MPEPQGLLGPSPGHGVLPKPPLRPRGADSAPAPVYPGVRAPGGPWPLLRPPSPPLGALTRESPLGHPLPPSCDRSLFIAAPRIPYPPSPTCFPTSPGAAGRDRRRRDAPRREEVRGPRAPRSWPSALRAPPPSVGADTPAPPGWRDPPPLLRGALPAHLLLRPQPGSPCAAGGVEIVGCQRPEWSPPSPSQSPPLSLGAKGGATER